MNRYAFAILIAQVSSGAAFVFPTTFGVIRSPSVVALEAIPSNHFFQLEELEDQDCATTEIFLNEDHTVSFGSTDGPLPTSSRGTWIASDEGSFEMKLRRTFETGSEGRPMGEFQYEVERSYSGSQENVGAVTAVSGSIHSVDNSLGDRRVGFFQLIDTGDSRSE
eukprot:CAMPEP_0202450750 /NCGR_PEP_ID=MMETSP1360-20130828/9318_1 /ASSEMBLY_ACC=CAM_ASM_000848 /TAXON_ID=515479 /ORGANISM="Licmophora paradoxa, Strain CCMP2313" /LENGTH=164 /DNA_ID=CAMNT_0049069131 /DNA_START=80 /DNA_END=574 /DNA_ORIENTATION=+